MVQTQSIAVPSRSSALPEFLKLLLLIAIPAPLLAYFSWASSYSVGVMLSCIGLLVYGATAMRGRRSPLPAALPGLLCGLAVIALHLLISSFLGPVDWGRGLGSLVMLAIFVAGALVLKQALLNIDPQDLLKGARYGLYGLAFTALLGILDWLQPDKATWPKSLFPFSEPSHLALFLAPILIFNCITAQPRARLLILAAALTATAILQNVTLATICLMTAVLCLSPRYLLLLAVTVVPALLLLDLEYYLVRLDFSGDSDNLTNLVFFQGWQLILEALERSHGFGLGFQQLGVFGTDSDAAELIRFIMGEYLNLLDGGFNLAKFIGEFGVFGMMLLAAFLYQLGVAIKLLRRTATRGQAIPLSHVFAACCMMGYTVELFLRGVGYFSPSGLLLLSAALIWLDRKPNSAGTVARSPCPTGISQQAR